MAGPPFKRQPMRQKVGASVWVNDKGAIASVNSRIWNVLGCEPEELLGKPFPQMVSEYIQRSNSSVPASFTIDWAPVQTTQGRILEIVLNKVSSPEHDDPFSQLAHSFFDESSDHISIVGNDYRYLAVNSAYEFNHGYTQNQIIGKHIADLLGERKFVEMVKPKIDRCLAGETVRYRTWINFKITGRRFMFVSYSPLRSPSGEIDKVGVISRDMTDMQFLENTLLSIQELLQYKQQSGSLNKTHTVPGTEADSSTAGMATLSSREQQIVMLIAQGKTNKEIAAEFNLSEKTVRNLLTALFRKLHITRRTEAVAMFAYRTPLQRL